MITSLQVKNFTAFSEVKLEFGKNLNVIVGENGAGKTHLLKLLYSVLATSWEEGRNASDAAPTREVLQTQLAEKLVNVFRSRTVGSLVRHDCERCDVQTTYVNEALNVSFGFTRQSASQVEINELPKAWADSAPVYFPTRELLTIYPGLVSAYESGSLQLAETWRDTCKLLGAPPKEGGRKERTRELLEPLEEVMGGSVELGEDGRFYLRTSSGRMEMSFGSEGLHRLGMLARLIENGFLLDSGCLFWEEPEVHLHPRIIRTIANSIFDLGAGGVQIFVSTHSLFLLREVEMLLASRGGDARFFGLRLSESGTSVQQGSSIEDMGRIAILDEELEQSDRFLKQGS